jgi:hypothetical protein
VNTTTGESGDPVLSERETIYHDQWFHVNVTVGLRKEAI